jgi:hypothetical protein
VTPRFHAALVASIAILGTTFSALPVRADHDHDPRPALSGDVVRTWNRIAQDTVRAESAIDAQAARVYAMVDVAMYDAVNGILSRRGSNDRDHALVPPQGAPAFGHPVAAAAAAAHAVLVGLYPARAAAFDAQLATDLAALGPDSRVHAGRQWGEDVGAAVLEARADDGSSPNETQPAGSGVGVFRAAWSGVQFRNLKPFAIKDAAVYVSPGPPAMDSTDYAGAYAEVKIVGNAAIPDAAKLATYQYWALGAGTSQPPGAWIEVARVVSASRSLDLADTARLFALASMAMADTVAPTYLTKFNVRFWRPTTAIREGDLDPNPSTEGDPAWSARAGTVGGSPEHWSGHSSFSASAAAVLTGFFCNDAIPFDLTVVPGGPTRHYDSFSAAAAEAGRSRVGGGIHFEFSNQAGLVAGRGVAAEVLAGSLLLKRGATHFGACPR